MHSRGPQNFQYGIKMAVYKIAWYVFLFMTYASLLLHCIPISFKPDLNFANSYIDLMTALYRSTRIELCVSQSNCRFPNISV